METDFALVQLNSLIGQLQNQTDALNLANQVLQGISATEHTQLDEAQAQVADLTDQLTTEKAKSADLQAQVDTANAAIVDLQTQLDVANASIAQLQQPAHQPDL